MSTSIGIRIIVSIYILLLDVDMGISFVRVDIGIVYSST